MMILCTKRRIKRPISVFIQKCKYPKHQSSCSICTTDQSCFCCVEHEINTFSMFEILTVHLNYVLQT